MRQRMDYPDRWFGLIGIPLWSVFHRHLGEPAPLIALLRDPQYYVDLGFLLAAAYGLWKLNQAIIRRMDQRYSWAAQPGRRLAVQAGLTFAGTVLLVLPLTLLYNQVVRLRAASYNLSYVLFTDLAAALLFALIIHLVYTGIWMITYHHREVGILQRKLAHLQQHADSLARTSEETRSASKKTLLASQGNGFMPVPTAQIAYITTVNEVSIARTFDGRSLTVTASLEQLTDQLAPGDFYRVSRQYIVNRSAITKVNGDAAGRLVLSLRPSPPQQTVVSRRRAAAFNQWMSA